MLTVGRVWSKAVRLRRGARWRTEPPPDWERLHKDWIRANAPGRSFADVGGMFKLVGDMAFLAEDVGATAVTMVDVGDPDLPCEGHLDWGRYSDKHAARGSSVRYVQGDLEDPASPERIGVHDVVFCSGVLYHTPNPMRQLLHLREITGELLYLSTLTMPEIPGFPQACVFYPYLSDAARAPYAAGYDWASDLLGIGGPVDERPMYGYGNCFWGMSRSALLAMLRTARFEVLEEHAVAPSPFALDLVCRPLPLDPMLPPLTYFRERGDALARGQGRLPFETWYDEQRAPAERQVHLHN